MIHLRIKTDKIRPAIISLIAGSLQTGQIVVLPTDTIYGLSCLATDIRAIKKIYHLKKRDIKKPVLVLASDLEMVKKYVQVSKQQESAAKVFWGHKSKPTTLIFKHKKLLPKELTANSDGLAVRLPKSRFLIKIIKTVGCPIVSTSLNFSGEKKSLDLRKIISYFPKKNNRPDLVVDNGPAVSRGPSRLVDLRSAKLPIIIRP